MPLTLLEFTRASISFVAAESWGMTELGAMNVCGNDDDGSAAARNGEEEKARFDDWCFCRRIEDPDLGCDWGMGSWW